MTEKKYSVISLGKNIQLESTHKKNLIKNHSITPKCYNYSYFELIGNNITCYYNCKEVIQIENEDNKSLNYKLKEYILFSNVLGEKKIDNMKYFWVNGFYDDIYFYSTN